MNSYTTAIVFVILVLSSCTKKASLVVSKNEKLNVECAVLPNAIYSISETWWSKTGQTKSKYDYEFEIIVEDFDNILVSTKDTIFKVEDFNSYSGPRINYSKMFEQGGEDGPTMCHTLDGRNLTPTDSINLYQNSNTFNHNAIRTWNRQNQIEIGVIGKGETIVSNGYSYDNNLSRTEYTLNSIDENLAKLTFQAKTYSAEEPEQLLRTERGTIEFDIKNQFFVLLERYVYPPNKTMFTDYFVTKIQMER
jgi:hypothetical protein